MVQPELPPKKDLSSSTQINRVDMRYWSIAIGVNADSYISINTRSKGVGRDNNNNPNNVEEPMEEVDIGLDASFKLTDMSLEFQDAVAVIQEELDTITVINEFPEVQ